MDVCGPCGKHGHADSPWPAGQLCGPVYQWLLTDNFGAACSVSYNVLEEIEISHKLGEVQDSPETPVTEPAS